MDALVKDMVQDDPSKRPTMDQVVLRFEHIRRQLSSYKLRSRVTDPGEGGIEMAFNSVTHLFRRIKYTLHRTPAIPSSWYSHIQSLMLQPIFPPVNNAPCGTYLSSMPMLNFLKIDWIDMLCSSHLFFVGLRISFKLSTVWYEPISTLVRRVSFWSFLCTSLLIVFDIAYYLLSGSPTSM